MESDVKAFPIWSMKYCTKEVLVDKLKVHKGKNFIYFCCDRNYMNLYSFDGDKVKSNCRLIYNSKIYCYAIPLDWLEDEGELPKELEKVREKEYNKYKKYKEKQSK